MNIFYLNKNNRKKRNTGTSDRNGKRYASNNECINGKRYVSNNECINGKNEWNEKIQ